MPETDRLSAAAAAMLHDIGQSGSRRLTGDDRDGELMRLSDNPLLIREFLIRQQTSQAGGGPGRSGLAAEAALQLQQSPGGRPGSGHRARYEQGHRRLEPSLLAEAFAPSAEDRAQAIADLRPALPGGPRRAVAPAVMALAALGLIMAIVIVSI